MKKRDKKISQPNLAAAYSDAQLRQDVEAHLPEFVELAMLLMNDLARAQPVDGSKRLKEPTRLQMQYKRGYSLLERSKIFEHTGVKIVDRELKFTDPCVPVALFALIRRMMEHEGFTLEGRDLFDDEKPRFHFNYAMLETEILGLKVSSNTDSLTLRQALKNCAKSESFTALCRESMTLALPHVKAAAEAVMKQTGTLDTTLIISAATNGMDKKADAIVLMTADDMEQMMQQGKTNKNDGEDDTPGTKPTVH